MRGGTKLALGIMGGVTLGGGVGYLVATTRAGRKVIERISEDPSIRLPDPSYAVEVAADENQFAILEDLVCECGAPIIQAADEAATIEELTTKIQSCMAAQLYPDFPWPPIPGDHPSAAQLYAELGFLARRALITTEICPPPIPPILPSPDIPFPTRIPGGA